MKGLSSNVTRMLPVGTQLPTCDNSGAKIVEIISVKNAKTTKGRRSTSGVGDEVTVTVVSGKPDMRHKVVQAVIVRQKKEFRRPDGVRIKFEDNSCVILKDDKGNPKGTIFKGPIAKEAVERFPAIGKIASMIV
jgi:large subunit ribosomal protein L14